MKLTGVLLLLGILTITFARGHKKGSSDDRGHKRGDLDWKQALRDEGFSEEEIAGFEAEARAAKAAAIAAAGDGEDISWREARGYDECEEFMDRKKKDREERPDHEDKPYHKGRMKVHKPKSLEEICEEIECPKVEEPESSGSCGFGVRNILGAKWASTDLDISDIEGSFLTAFFRLLKYSRGANDQGAKIAHTVPVITKWYLDRNFEKTEATMHFYIPEEFQKNTPVPTDDAVEVEEWVDTVVYHRTFGDDRMDEEIYRREFENLATALSNDDVDFYPYIAVTGGFTRPGHGRQRNEVMFLEW